MFEESQIDVLKQQIIDANRAYREGHPSMSDQEFDDLCDELQKKMPKIEWDMFRNSLHEESGDVHHPFIMGSLDKVKMEDPKSLMKFINTYVTTTLNVSAKIDGMSCRLEYMGGKLDNASTRGDGEKGVNCTDRIMFVKDIPLEIPIKERINIRGELVILKDDFNKMEGFANPRNATAGLFNRKEWKKTDIENVSFVAYTILGPEYTKEEQFKILEKCGFKTACHVTFTKSEIKSDKFIPELEELFEQDLEYECDGLVLSDSTYRNEDTFRPDAQIALKINQQVGVSKVIDISWQGPSKDGRFVPLAVVEPVEIGGTMVSKASLHNAAFMKKLGIHYGSEVEICKRGDIIPQIERVL